MQVKKKLIAKKASDFLKKNRDIKENYFFYAQGMEFIGFPGVVSPKTSPSTEVWKGLPIKKGESFLEVGCGTGVFSVLAAKIGESEVVAVDISEEAVANTTVNACLHNVDNLVHAYKSDIFNRVPTSKKFDLILWNIPWCSTDKTELSPLEMTIFDQGNSLLDRYLRESIPYLTSKGRLLLGYSSTYGNVSRVYELADLYGWKIKLMYQVGSKDSFFAELFELIRE